MNLRVYKLRPDAKLPYRAYETDAGMDLFYCPNGEKRKILDIEGLKIAQAVLIPIIHCGVEEIFSDELNNNTVRGEGGFGSTGDK